MPLYEADGSIDPYTLKTVPEKFVIFYSSIEHDGKMWCPDCRAVEELVKDAFSDSGPEALIVYVGNKAQWKCSTNAYRQKPWTLTSIPTIVRIQDGQEIGRLTDDSGIIEGLKEFVKA
ncbi:hypothetical protein B0H34DRAFT_792080 [Crassisporium funariophilum]|nr:hypothetical protein B0H34DRAFT_792080 [Crassisporium funariophilum]